MEDNILIDNPSFWLNLAFLPPWVITIKQFPRIFGVNEDIAAKNGALLYQYDVQPVWWLITLNWMWDTPRNWLCGSKKVQLGESNYKAIVKYTLATYYLFCNRINWEERWVWPADTPNVPTCVDTTCISHHPNHESQHLYHCVHHKNKGHVKYCCAISIVTKRVVYAYARHICASQSEITIVRRLLLPLLLPGELTWADGGIRGENEILNPPRGSKHKTQSPLDRLWRVIHSKHCFQLIETGPNQYLKRWRFTLMWPMHVPLEILDFAVICVWNLYNDVQAKKLDIEQYV